jgi:hypothetical protein
MAAITPGIQPQQVSIHTSSIAPHPRSSTASGGKIIQIMALRMPITSNFLYNKDILFKDIGRIGMQRMLFFQTFGIITKNKLVFQ